MAQVMELSDHEFQTFMINMLGALTEKVNNRQAMGNVSRGEETLRKNQ